VSNLWKKKSWFGMMLFEIPDTQKSVTERICRKRGKEKMSQIFGAIMLVVMGILGGLPTLYLCVSLVVVLAQKIYGKVVHGKSLYA
jgi:type III secretory pathway component EscV